MTEPARDGAASCGCGHPVDGHGRRGCIAIIRKDPEGCDTLCPCTRDVGPRPRDHREPKFVEEGT